MGVTKSEQLVYSDDTSQSIRILAVDVNGLPIPSGGAGSDVFVTNTALNPVPTTFPPGTVVGLDAATLAALETITTIVSVMPDVNLSATTLAALETINAVVSGTVALDASTLSALETITAIINTLPDVNLSAATLAALENITAVVSGTVTVVDGGGSLTTDGTFDERYSGGKLAFATTVAAAGDTVLVTPAAGKAVRVVWVAAVPSSDNANANLVKFKFGAGGSPFYQAYAIAHWEVFQGAVDTPLVVNCTTAENVAVTVHYREV